MIHTEGRGCEGTGAVNWLLLAWNHFVLKGLGSGVEGGRELCAEPRAAPMPGVLLVQAGPGANRDPQGVRLRVL